ncbi:tRNA epoxyqueuosine(34) reductase QueG [Cupriavidus sp. AU9028]|uniref:tRNA epoxyqueuosine(34) reductase QueG n=1 Tax=Cupriavidus sp. AU9028 TaxID=2871157 RepID=UPI001C943149|nr:tRNA epoxyqueuosine(34) reductase QueG [Cupriavidus sp. AU9028]MBY4895482.1 tRNA epoxyqueuosine(34) reductase QueG [Cupriavidus sp. AU9028]
MIDPAARAEADSPGTACAVTSSAPQAPGPAQPPAVPAPEAASPTRVYEPAALVERIRAWGAELGFDDIRIADVDLRHAEAGLMAWLEKGFHGDMDYMANHGLKRARPAELVPGTVRAIVARMPYLPASMPADWRQRELARLDPDTSTGTGQGDDVPAVISVYARGRDYHKVLRARLQQLATRIANEIGPFGYRVFTDSAPVMEVALASQGGLGWRGKHTLLLDRAAGSLFFLGEILIDVPLPADPPASAHCGQCRRCIDVCPTGAIVAPYQLDARRCISYLTIEYKGAIPEPLRAPMGNRVYGCDDCQLACPWNKFAQRATLPDFDVRNKLDAPDMVTLFGWTEQEFNQRLEGSPIRRIGHERWLRNLAVGLGNALRDAQGPAAQRIRAALQARQADPSPLVREHVEWALAQQRTPAALS